MECQTSDKKNLFKVFEASRCKRTRKKGCEDTNSVATDDSNGAIAGLVASAKGSLQDTSDVHNHGPPEPGCSKRDRDSSPSLPRSPHPEARQRVPRHHRRHQREGLSLALKPGHMSTPRSTSPPQDVAAAETATQDQDSLVYAFLEDAIRRDKRKQRHAQRHEEHRKSREREASVSRDHHRHRHHRDAAVTSRDREKSPVIEQAMLLKTFAEFCAQINKKTPHCQEVREVQRTQSHKSLQCEVLGRPCDVEQRPVKLRSHEHSWENIPSSRVRSHDNMHGSRCRVRSPDRAPLNPDDGRERGAYMPYEKGAPKYSSKLDVVPSRMRNVVDDRHRDYAPHAVPTRSCVDQNYRARPPPDPRDYREYDDRRGRNYAGDTRTGFEQKTSRSFEVHREGYVDDDRCRPTARSDSHRRHYEEPREGKRFEDQRGVRDRRYEGRKDKYYDDKPFDGRDRHVSNLPSKDRRSRRNLERFEKTSVASRDEYRERDRYSERERDSGMSVADCETSIVSGRSTCLKVVKQEIAEQREAMDKMMKLWKELMRCFKGMPGGSPDKTVQESTASVQESAAAQLRLWRECMRRYETVARDVGDTDARLMEEIGKQRSEMAEMSGMWQECLQRYREMSNEFNNLKEKLSKPESPSRAAVAPPLVCAEGEGACPAPPYRMPHAYPQMPPLGGGYGCGGGSPLRARASAPPAWWWCEPPRAHRSPRRRSSPESRGSRDRERRRAHKERDDARYKEKSTKPSAARSEHRHRKR